MVGVHVISLKVGTSHGLWQYKYPGTHERAIVHGLRHVLGEACRLLGYDLRDRSIVYLFSFSEGPFQGHQAGMQKIREAPDGCRYKVVESMIGDFKAEALVPDLFRTHYLHAWPEKFFFRIERSLAGGIVG